ncbi:MAG: hypothetical protein ACYDG3_08995 [Bacillati bacterium]
MVSVVLAMLLATASGGRFPAIVPPREGAVCAGSPLVLTLLQNNLPQGNLYSTSIVNIWAFIDRRGGAAKAWLYKNWLGHYYIAFSETQKPSEYPYLRGNWRFFGDPGGGVYGPRRVHLRELLGIENALGAHGILRVSCFSHDAKMG